MLPPSLRKSLARWRVKTLNAFSLASSNVELPGSGHTDSRLVMQLLSAYRPVVWTLTAVEIALFCALYREMIPFSLYMLVHTGLTLVLCRWVQMLHRNRKMLVFPLLLVVMFAVLGPLGSGLCLVASFLYSVFAEHSSPFQEWYESLFPEEGRQNTQRIYERIIFGLDDVKSESNVEPFYDILSFGTIRQKQDVLFKIAKHFQPSFAPSLMLALQDAENIIRVQAATVIAKVQESFMKQSLPLEKALQKENAGIREHEELAAIYSAYADSGILDKTTELETRFKAIHLYEHCLREDGSNPKLLLALAKHYLKSKQTDKACAVLKTLVEQEENESVAETLLCYLEALHAMQNYAAMHQVVRNVDRMPLENTKSTAKTEILALLDGWRSLVSSKTGEAHYG